MSIDFTIDDLIRYIYKETNQRENIQIRNSIKIDEKLKEEYFSLKKTCNCLNVLKTCPDNELVDKLFKHLNN